MQTPTIGRIVHYRFSDAEGGMERPAIIVRVWGEHVPGSAVQLQVFTDANEHGQHNDGYSLKAESSVVWRTSILQGSEPGQYHFHEDCPLT
jgi:hypothetical protein